MFIGNRKIKSIEVFILNTDLSSVSHRITFFDNETLERFRNGDVGKKVVINSFCHYIDKSSCTIKLQAQEAIDSYTLRGDITVRYYYLSFLF